MNYTVFANWVPVVTTTATTDSITFEGFTTGYVFLSIFAMDIHGNPFFGSFELLFGDISMPVLVLDSGGLPAAGVYVQANATTYPGVGQSGLTDINGQYVFKNLMATTISLVAKGINNQVAVDGIAASISPITLKLLAFTFPTEVATLDFSNGTQGWTGGSLISHVEKRDNDLFVYTNNLPNVQIVSSSINLTTFAKTAYVRYKFVTEEVPGGFFGTIYNDYFSVTIRSDIGGYATVTNSMNALGLGAFDSAGATQWYTLSLDVTGAHTVDFDIAVSNVADALYQSEVIVDKIGELQCEKCGDCTTCPGDPMCQSSCQNPPPKSCAFYRSCVDATVPCGSTGYAFAYGEKNCNRFQNNINMFSAGGQQWVWGVMTCLQGALRSAVTFDATCTSIRDAAFASHAPCYVSNGVCPFVGILNWSDYLSIFATIGDDLAQMESIKQELQTAAGCAAKTVSAVGQAIVDLGNSAVDAVVSAEQAALQIVNQWFENVLSEMP
jgi:hypothetical protein